MGLFDRFKKPAKQPEVQGGIGYHGLADWWLNEFSEDERQLIEQRLTPLFANETVTLTKGSPGDSFKADGSKIGAFDFLRTLAAWFQRKDQVPLALKVLKKAREFDASPAEWHWYYSTFIEVRYKQRDDDPQALNDVIRACEEMIRIAPDVIKQWKHEEEAIRARLADFYHKSGQPPAEPRSVVPPGHKGYQQLTIIRKKQKNLEGEPQLLEN